jgi:outer membrane protein assembly factor BamB
VFTTTGDVSATPAVDDTTVYFPDWGGNLYAVDKLTGKEKWHVSIADVSGVPFDKARATPAVTDDKVVIGTQGSILVPGGGPGGKVLAFNKFTGVLEWSTTLDTNPAAIITQSATVFDGKVYIGGYPDYGLLGGGIGVYDPEKNERRVYRHVVTNQSIISLTYIEKLDLIAAGSSILGGTGTRAVEKEAKLMLWDPKQEKKLFEIIPIQGAKAVLSLATAVDGTVYGITNNEKVFVFDPGKREITKIFDLGFKEPREISLQLGPDLRLYGLAKDAIFSVDPRNDHISLIAAPPVEISSGMAMLGRKIYYGSGAALWEFEIPIEPCKPVE